MSSFFWFICYFFVGWFIFVVSDIKEDIFDACFVVCLLELFCFLFVCFVVLFVFTFFLLQTLRRRYLMLSELKGGSGGGG